MHIRKRKDCYYSYHPAYGGPSLKFAYPTLDLALKRSSLVMDFLKDQSLFALKNLITPTMVSYQDMLLAHEESYLEVLSGNKGVEEQIGAVLTSQQSEAILKAHRSMAGGTVLGTFWVLKEKSPFFLNMGGGFHHAYPTKGGGYCLINDIAIAIKKAQARGYEKKICILDLDFHQGDANFTIFQNDLQVDTLSLFGKKLLDQDYPGQHQLRPFISGQEYLESLQKMLDSASSYDLVYYIAGTDVLATDPLGEFSLTKEDVFLRDQMVLSWANSIQSKMVVTFGGGYSPDSWQCYAHLAGPLLFNKNLSKVTTFSKAMNKFNRIFHSLSRNKLQFSSKSDQLTFSYDDIFMDLQGQAKSDLILDFYTPSGVEFALEKYGILKKLRRQGYHHHLFEYDLSDKNMQKMRLYDGRNLEDENKELLIELNLSIKTLLWEDVSTISCLCIEWLFVRNPRHNLTHFRPLPGQETPGLGVSKDIQLMLAQAAKRLQLDGLLIHPAYYHVAVLGNNQYRFLDPKIQGLFQGLQKLMINKNLFDVQKEIESGRINRKTDTSPLLPDRESFEWPAKKEFILPLCPKLQDYFEDQKYLVIVKKCESEFLGLSP